MRKLTGYINAVAGRILFIGFTLQIVAGLIWFACNFAHFQQFAQVDSLLYPLILMTAEGMGKICPIPYYCYIYVLQMLAWIAAAYFFTGVVQKIFVRKKSVGIFLRAWTVATTVTAVPVMQCILALLPYALTGALMLTELGTALDMIYGLFSYKNANDNSSGNDLQTGLYMKQITVMTVMWIIQTLLLHEYLLFGMIPLLAVIAAQIAINRRKSVRMTVAGVIAVCAVSTVLTGIYGICRKTGLYEESRQGFIRELFSRTVLTTILKDWDNWTEEIAENIDFGVNVSSSYYADNITLEFIPYADEKYGSDADDFYLRTIKAAWSMYRTQIVHEVIWDAAGYACTPIIAKRQLEGQGYTSLTARNYDIMKRNTPIITKYYVNYFSDWFLTALIIMAVCALCAAVKTDRIKMTALIICAVSYIVMCTRYVIMGAGIMDYKRTAVITATWIVLMIVPVLTALNTDKSGDSR
jgi:hypothetical protein